MKQLILFSCLFIALAAHAQKERGEAYINAYKELAMTEMLRTGVPASITLAQGILESQFGESDLVKGSNNHFGIKCKTEWTGPKMYHDDDEKGECFRVYTTAAESYKDHSDFLKMRPNYAFLFKLDPTDFDGWAKGLKKAGYATSPVYPQKLLKVINDYNLQQYSLEALARLNNPSSVIETIASTTAVVVNSANTISKEETTKQTETGLNQLVEKTAVPEQPVKEELVITNSLSTTPEINKLKKQVPYPAGIFTINHAKVIYVAEGTSLLSLANQYDIPLSKLIEFNDLAEMDVLDTDRLIFIERKPKKTTTDFHLVVAGETLHDICQQEGIRLDSLLEYNHLVKNAMLTTGNKIYLHAITSAPPSPKAPK
ncbi:MAG: glucosaminidase domain-containing protein [Sediminibacterium sp.]